MSIINQSGSIVETRSGVYPERSRRNACSGWFRFMQANGAAKTLATTIPSLQNKHREGRPQDPNTWSYQLTPFGALNITDRGYTFHVSETWFFNKNLSRTIPIFGEHLIEFSLINMNGRMYDPVLGRVISPDNYIQAPDNTQSFNRYSYCWNNPLKYSDPSGNLIWVIPNVGWSSNGGLSFGLTFGMGIPGGASIQAGLIYNTKSSDLTGFVGATLAFNTLYVSASTNGGFSAGYAFGASIFSGMPISSNIATAGVSYNFNSSSFGINLAGMQYSKDGLSYDLSVSVMVYPEHSTNFVRGKGFRSNNTVLSNFVTKGHYQKALNYFGFEGIYDPTNPLLKGAPAVTSTTNGETYFNTNAFTDGFDRLYAISDHESIHRLQYSRYGRYMQLHDKNSLEYEAYLHNYKNEGLYRNHNSNFRNEINNAATKMGMNHESYLKYSYSSEAPFSHGFYRIPRKW